MHAANEPRLDSLLKYDSMEPSPACMQWVGEYGKRLMVASIHEEVTPDVIERECKAIIMEIKNAGEAYREERMKRLSATVNERLADSLMERKAP